MRRILDRETVILDDLGRHSSAEIPTLRFKFNLMRHSTDRVSSHWKSPVFCGLYQEAYSSAWVDRHVVRVYVYGVPF
jgi:hypothetical protein